MSLAFVAFLAAQAAPSEPAIDPSPAVERVNPQDTSVRLHALTPISVVILTDLSGKGAVTGQEFDLALAYPVPIGDGYVIPAGTPGRGWVVHANSPKMGGKAGELLLGARYLQLGDIRIPLRSLKVGAPGKDNTGLAMGVTAAVGVVGVLISGGDSRVASGMQASAKIAADVDLPIGKLTPLSAVVLPNAEPQSPSTTKE